MSPKPELLAALQRCANEPVIIESNVGTMFCIVSILQLGLRHPRANEADSPAEQARIFIEDFKTQLREREPLLVKLVEMGDQPQHDR